jgi:hypothetical protein
MMRRHEHLEAIKGEIERCGGRVTRTVKGRKHVRVYFEHRGVERFYVTAATPSGASGLLQACTDIRHLMGAIKTEKRVGARRRHKPRKKPALAALPAAFTTTADPFQVLKTHALADDVVRLRWQRAWQEFWNACMAAVMRGRVA